MATPAPSVVAKVADEVSDKKNENDREVAVAQEQTNGKVQSKTHGMLDCSPGDTNDAKSQCSSTTVEENQVHQPNSKTDEVKRDAVSSEKLTSQEQNSADTENLNDIEKRRKKKSPRMSTNSSNFRGVSWDRSMNAWRTKINSVHLGYFDDENEAARAYDEAALTLKDGSPNIELNFQMSSYYENGVKLKWPAYKTKHGVTPRGSSSYRGVMWDKNSKAWRAKIKSNCKTIYLGVYDCEEDAARAYDKAAAQVHGEKAKFNFPESENYANEIKGKKFTTVDIFIPTRKRKPYVTKQRMHALNLKQAMVDDGNSKRHCAEGAGDTPETTQRNEEAQVSSQQKTSATGTNKEGQESETVSRITAPHITQGTGSKSKVDHQTRLEALSQDQLEKAISKVNKLSMARKIAQSLNRRSLATVNDDDSDSSSTLSSYSSSTNERLKKKKRRKKRRKEKARNKATKETNEHKIVAPGTFPPTQPAIPMAPALPYPHPASFTPYMQTMFHCRWVTKQGVSMVPPPPGKPNGPDSANGTPGHLRHDPVTGGFVFVCGVEFENPSNQSHQNMVPTAMPSMPPSTFGKFPPMMYMPGGPMPMYASVPGLIPPPRPESSFRRVSATPMPVPPAAPTDQRAAVEGE